MTDPARGAVAEGVWEFDPQGAVDPGARDRVISDIGHSGARDVVVLAHGWNNDPGVAGEFDARFFALLREAAPEARMARVGVRWPAMRFLDESAPHVPEEQRRAALDALPALDAATARALVDAFPASGDVVHELCDLLARRPAGGLALDDFGTLLRRLVELRLTDARAEFASDAEDDLLPQHDPVMLFDDTAGVCGEFAAALDEAREAVEATHHRPERIERHSEGDADVSHHGTHAESAVLGPRAPDALSSLLDQKGPVQTAGGFGDERFATGHDELWRGAHELLRQVAGHTFRRRAGVVGTYGLGPVLALLARNVPGVRIHLVGHGFGARLVAYAVRNQAEDSRAVASMVLLQPALSHFAFADHMPHQMRGGGALAGCLERLAGPLVCCYSHNDLELGLMHPLATRMIGDSASLSGIDRKWGALGHDGAQASASFTAIDLAEMLRSGMGERQCVNVDVSEVVREGDPPAGAHNDVFHPDLARLVVQVAGIGRED
ncbi:serine-threonine protein kinase [Streptomyces sp. YC504]|uniref:Serine-threonine protein kinase n=1 Tax=Streptomyces mesophilus TaxID=1775132 RepID=A0A6G4XC20_9ACTN|nr:serine-threonine protein kinase [Streptomyces mesophilus]NGO74938.1 serine-threonine protein kinase [Streptomyces mesophilus]